MRKERSFAAKDFGSKAAYEGRYIGTCPDPVKRSSGLFLFAGSLGNLGWIAEMGWISLRLPGKGAAA
jgi:hypothetical protein